MTVLTDNGKEMVLGAANAGLEAADVRAVAGNLIGSLLGDILVLDLLIISRCGPPTT